MESISSLSLVPNNNNLINIMQVLLSFIKYKQENISLHFIFAPFACIISGQIKTEQILPYILEDNTIVLERIQTEFITEQVISKNVRKS